VYCRRARKGATLHVLERRYGNPCDDFTTAATCVLHTPSAWTTPTARAAFGAQRRAGVTCAVRAYEVPAISIALAHTSRTRDAYVIRRAGFIGLAIRVGETRYGHNALPFDANAVGGALSIACTLARGNDDVGFAQMTRSGLPVDQTCIHRSGAIGCARVHMYIRTYVPVAASAEVWFTRSST
jgi:hypothetical protein